MARGCHLPRCHPGAWASAVRIALTREALLRVDVLLPRFFLPEHAGIRYT